PCSAAAAALLRPAPRLQPVNAPGDREQDEDCRPAAVGFRGVTRVTPASSAFGRGAAPLTRSPPAKTLYAWSPSVSEMPPVRVVWRPSDWNVPFARNSYFFAPDR